MDGESNRPARTDESEVAGLTDEQLEEYIGWWRGQGAGYRNLRRQVGRDHPDAFRYAHSGWWCGKRESTGLSEQARRRAVQRTRTPDG